MLQAHQLWSSLLVTVSLRIFVALWQCGVQNAPFVSAPRRQ